MVGFLDWVECFNGVIVMVEYWFVLEFFDLYLVEDCYVGFVWIVEYVYELGIDFFCLLIGGVSVGGGFVVGIVLLVCDCCGLEFVG